MATPQDKMTAPRQRREPPPGVKLLPPDTPDPEVPALTEEQDILYQGGMGENADIGRMLQSANARVQGSTLPVPTRLLRMLPILRDASMDPNQPESVRSIYRATVLSIESRMKNA